LVDRIGTLDDAIAEAKSLAGLKAEEPIDRLNLPKPKTFFESLLGDSGPEERFKLAMPQLRELGQLGKTLGDAEQFSRLFDRPAVLVLPYRLEIK
jgi:ClpP class serine protease